METSVKQRDVSVPEPATSNFSWTPDKLNSLATLSEFVVFSARRGI